MFHRRGLRHVRGQYYAGHRTAAVTARHSCRPIAPGLNERWPNRLDQKSIPGDRAVDGRRTSLTDKATILCKIQNIKLKSARACRSSMNICYRIGYRRGVLTPHVENYISSEQREIITGDYTTCINEINPTIDKGTEN